MSKLRSGEAVMAAADVAWHREQMRLKADGALKAEPMTPAGKWAAVEALLNPVECYVCPHCGHNAERPGQPMISRDDAMKLLDFPDLDSPASIAILADESDG